MELIYESAKLKVYFKVARFLPSIEWKCERVLHVRHARVVLYETESKRGSLHGVTCEAVISLWQSPFH